MRAYILRCYRFLPFLLTLVAWFPSLVASTFTETLLSFVVTCGLLYMLASYSRTVGKRHEVPSAHGMGRLAHYALAQAFGYQSFSTNDDSIPCLFYAKYKWPQLADA